MPVTDIKVYGSARDIRTSDRAEVRLKVSKWGRDWDSTHDSVMGAVDSIINEVKKLMTDNPQGLYEPTIEHLSQKTWNDDIGTAYSESVNVAVVFTDFQVMSHWIFVLTSDTTQVESISWGLAQATKKELNIALCVEAMSNARRQAETLAVSAGLTITGIQTVADPGLFGTTSSVVTEPTSSEPTTTPGGHEDDAIDITPTMIETVVRLAVHFLAEPDPDHNSFPAARRTPSPFFS
ncbi:MAG: SIMPL domain-containing protein [Propionibacteriaceae bacterium]|nr:SIMPL domain-containing protein [Propionibacteriaceae bacterium]